MYHIDFVVTSISVYSFKDDNTNTSTNNLYFFNKCIDYLIIYHKYVFNKILIT